MWDERYSANEYAYGKEPNDFLRQHARLIPAGQVLCLADGEGRNSVYLAQQGYQVVAIDSSSTGLKKAHKLAAERNVEIETRHADLAEFNLGKDQWDGIVSIFCHLPPEIRQALHRQVVQSLKPGAYLILEAYTPEQLDFKTGGPAVAEMTMTSQNLNEELRGLEFISLNELRREVHEGSFHNGIGAVVQLIARKP